MKKKWYILLIMAGILLLSCAAYKIRNSFDWQQRKMARTVQKQEAEFYRNEAELSALAKQILDTTLQEFGKADSQQEWKVIWLDKAEDREHPAYGDLLDAYIKNNRTVFESVEVHSLRYRSCPAQSCIFRTTQYFRLNEERSVYSWVNLVYNENWQTLLEAEEYRHCVEQGLVKELTSNWCIVIEYGY